MAISNDIARASGALNVAIADLDRAIVNTINAEANMTAGFQVIEAVYDILSSGQDLEAHEIGEIADMLHEGIQRARGVRVEAISEKAAA